MQAQEVTSLYNLAAKVCFIALHGSSPHTVSGALVHAPISECFLLALSAVIFFKTLPALSWGRQASLTKSTSWLDCKLQCLVETALACCDEAQGSQHFVML